MDSRQTRLAVLISMLAENAELNAMLDEYVDFAKVYRGDLQILKEAGMPYSPLGRSYYEVKTEYGDAYVEVVG